MRAEHIYRVTKLVTVDYGDGPSAGKEVTAHLSVQPDGSHWASRPRELQIRITEGALAIGDSFKLVLEKLP